LLNLYTNINFSNIIHYFFYFIGYLVFINTKILEEIFKINVYSHNFTTKII